MTERVTTSKNVFIKVLEHLDKPKRKQFMSKADGLNSVSIEFTCSSLILEISLKRARGEKASYLLLPVTMS